MEPSLARLAWVPLGVSEVGVVLVPPLLLSVAALAVWWVFAAGVEAGGFAVEGGSGL